MKGYANNMDYKWNYSLFHPWLIQKTLRHRFCASFAPKITSNFFKAWNIKTSQQLYKGQKGTGYSL